MTKRSQRVGIWIIAIVMGVGSLGIYFVAVLANQNTANDSAQQAKLASDYQTEVDKLSSQYYPILSGYASEVGSFEASSVSSLQSQDLKVGDGETIGDSTSYNAYYVGWNPKGKIFDESIDGSKLKAPLPITNNSGVIEGWIKGVKGMKLGGVRELTIPAAQAYGSTAVSDDIPADTPLKFIILAIPTNDTITQYNQLSSQSYAQ